jgi:hypothetical protein
LNWTFSSLFHNRAALLALGNAIPNCKHGAKERGREKGLEKAFNSMILKRDGGSPGKLEKTHAFGGVRDRVKPARNPAKSTS